MQEEYYPSNNNFVFPSIAIIFVGALIAGTIYWQSKPSNLPTCAPDQKNYLADFPVPNATDNIKGSLFAEAILIEYSDTECPYCKVAHQALSEIAGYYSADNLAWIYRHMPFDEIHSKSRKESEAAECAGEQGPEKFWAFLDEIFNRTESNDSLPVEELTKIAAEQNLNLSKWNSCITNRTYLAKIDAQAKAGLQAGVIGTPYIFIIPKTPFNKHDIEALSRYDVYITPDGRYATIEGPNVRALETAISLIVRKAQVR